MRSHWEGMSEAQLWEDIVAEPLMGTLQAPPAQELHRAATVWRGIILQI